jgi:peptidoglycan/LPS O-acetylase OafA/YrhL
MRGYKLIATSERLALVGKNSKSPRLEFLDAMRGVAALMVVYYHVCGTSIIRLGLRHGWERSGMASLYSIEDLGKTGIVLFFAISGFVIPMSFGAGSRPVTMFIISRAFRLYPAYWVSLALAVVVQFVMHSTPFSGGVILANLTMLQSALHIRDVIGVYWTLFIEWIFYIFCVGAFMAGKLGDTVFSFVGSIGMLGLAICMAMMRYMTHLKLPVALVLALSIMIWASLWRNGMLHGDQRAKRFSMIYLTVFIVVLPIVSLLAYNFNAGFDEKWYRYTIGYYVGMGCFLLFSTVLRLERPSFVWLGTISYSVYLLHPLALDFVVRLNNEKLPFGSGNLLFLEVALCTLLMAHFCFIYVEKPCIRLGHKMRARLQNRDRITASRSALEW